MKNSSSDGLISIVMPFKNTAVFLEECIQSILSQSYENWELIAVNDHSTDNSEQIIQAISDGDMRISVLQNEGSGIISALQTAYKQSVGGFITRMDSDDIMPHRKLETLLKNLQKHGKGYLSTGLVSYFSEKGISEGFHNYEQWLNKLTSSGLNFTELYKECVIPSPCWMIYREDFDACGGFNSDTYPEDYDLVFRFYKSGLKCTPCNDILHLWRDYTTRTSRTDPNYADNGFLVLKTHYFLALSYNNTKPLALWGAGKKGKFIARKLIEANIAFTWVCDNPKKLTKQIYNHGLCRVEDVEELKEMQHVISIAQPAAQIQIKNQLNSLGLQPMKDYYFFC